MDKSEIAGIVAEVLNRLEDRAPGLGAVASAAGSAARGGASGAGDFVYSDLDAAVAACARAQAGFQEMGLEQRGRIIDAMRRAGIDNAEPLARMARDETGMGRYEDKVRKNLLVSTKTPGLEDLHAEAYTGDKGLTLVEYAPFGVVGAVTPSTNPTSTIINNSISILAGGNSVLFAPHPAAVKCCRETMRLLGEAIVAAGGPRGLIATVDPASQEGTRALLAHPGVRLNLVTGGPAIVKIAMTVGKSCKTIAAGPGNPPVVVDETALLPKAAEDIISGASFDNNVLCTAEKEVIVVEAAKARFLEAMRRDPRGYELSPSQIDAVTKLVIVEGGKGCKDPRLNREFVGKDAAVIARGIGLDVPERTRLLWAEVPPDHPFIWVEQLMPVLPVTSARDVESAVEFAYEAEGENHHTSAMHSMNVANLTLMGRRMACSIYVKNAPTYYGLGMGEGYASVSIGTPTGDGLTKARHFVRPLQCSLVGYFRIA
ncbi:MAG: aldehyde dehydrogenase family protein [Elusimicrobiota bacterium]